MNLPSSAVFYRYRPAAWLRITGADAAEFLQGQFTNDLRPVPGGAPAYGLWLDHKGKVLADSFIGHGPSKDEFWIASMTSLGAAIRGRLEEYVIADDVVVEEGPEGSAVALLGEGVGAWLAAEPRPGVYFRGRRSQEENWEWIFPAAAAAAVSAALAGAREGEAVTLERRRILEGIPSVPADIGGGDLPNEGGLETAAISYNKGCYLGQEVMARLKLKGRIRRRIRRVSGPGAVPATPAALWQGETKVGELRTAAADEAGTGWVGLALLTLANLREEIPLALAAGGAPPDLRLEPLA
jgi:tRNA-modifying protein YgfZ